MDYKEGDIVLISIDHEKKSKYPSGINSEMEALNYHIAKIAGIINKNRYNIDLDHCVWTWNSEMFLSLDNLPKTINSKVFGDIIINKISDLNDEYPVEVILQDGDIINLTKDFKYFKNSKSSIL